jgi:hypothetical protein
MSDSAEPVVAAADPAVTARDFIVGACAPWQARLGRDLLGVYLLGSLAHGGFSARYSDLDVTLITNAGVTPAALAALRADAATISSELAAKLSFFWCDRHFSIGRFPPLDRIDYLDHAVTLVEHERVLPPRPSLSAVRDYLCGTPFAKWERAAHDFAANAALTPDKRKAYLRALLYPARFVFSFVTGRMGSNDEAVDFLDTHAPPGLDVALAARALACRRAEADPDSLFGQRALLPRQVTACAQLIADSESSGSPA